MSFAKTLERLEGALSDPYQRVRYDSVLVKRRDLQEMLEEFSRVDARARRYYQELYPEHCPQ